MKAGQVEVGMFVRKGGWSGDWRTYDGKPPLVGTILDNQVIRDVDKTCRPNGATARAKVKQAKFNHATQTITYDEVEWPLSMLHQLDKSPEEVLMEYCNRPHQAGRDSSQKVKHGNKFISID